MDEIRAKRGKKGALDNSSEEEEEEEGDRDYGDDDDDDEEQMDGKAARGYGTAKAEEEEQVDVTLEELIESKICITRSTLVKWVHESYFKDAVVGCYVRLGIGKLQETGKEVRRRWY